MREQVFNNRRLSLRSAERVRFLAYLPAALGLRRRKKWPLLFFLHGAGERGNDLHRVKAHGVPRRIEEGAEFPFVVVAPQCPEGAIWDPHVLSALMDVVVRDFPVDEERVYVTGMSMGGAGTWALAHHCPDRVAAIAPVCAPFQWLASERLRHLPVWCFHGAMDSAVPVDDSIRMIRQLRGCGSDVRLTIYPDADHDAWTLTYREPELYEWFLKHRRGHRQG